MPNDEIAVKKIYDIKKREPQKPLILMSNSIENLLPYVQDVSSVAKSLIERYFPGALTLVLPKSDKTPDFISANLPTVGIRIPNNPVFKEICEIIPGHVLATTSANLSHQPSAKTYIQACTNMQNLADIIIEDYGHVAQGLESTVVGFKEGKPVIYRQGAIVLDV